MTSHTDSGPYGDAWNVLRAKYADLATMSTAALFDWAENRLKKNSVKSTAGGEELVVRTFLEYANTKSWKNRSYTSTTHYKPSSLEEKLARLEASESCGPREAYQAFFGKHKVKSNTLKCYSEKTMEALLPLTVQFFIMKFKQQRAKDRKPSEPPEISGAADALGPEIAGSAPPATSTTKSTSKSRLLHDSGRIPEGEGEGCALPEDMQSIVDKVNGSLDDLIGKAKDTAALTKALEAGIAIIRFKFQSLLYPPSVAKHFSLEFTKKLTTLNDSKLQAHAMKKPEFDSFKAQIQLAQKVDNTQIWINVLETNLKKGGQPDAAQMQLLAAFIQIKIESWITQKKEAGQAGKSKKASQLDFVEKEVDSEGSNLFAKMKTNDEIFRRFRQLKIEMFSPMTKDDPKNLQFVRDYYNAIVKAKDLKVPAHCNDAQDLLLKLLYVDPVTTMAETVHNTVFKSLRGTWSEKELDIFSDGFLFFLNIPMQKIEGWTSGLEVQTLRVEKWNRMQRFKIAHHFNYHFSMAENLDELSEEFGKLWKLYNENEEEIDSVVMTQIILRTYVRKGLTLSLPPEKLEESSPFNSTHIEAYAAKFKKLEPTYKIDEKIAEEVISKLRNEVFKVQDKPPYLQYTNQDIDPIVMEVKLLMSLCSTIPEIDSEVDGGAGFNQRKEATATEGNAKISKKRPSEGSLIPKPKKSKSEVEIAIEKGLAYMANLKNVKPDWLDN